ncbi:MAG: hypothetical protein WAV95_19595 [Azonexus sp.]
MSDLSAFGSTAKGLARNPLGIIALFIVLIYGFAALTLGFNSHLDAGERLPLVWFLVLFPVAVLALFGWLVSQHNEKLYAPSDYRSDDSFLRRKEQSEKHTAQVTANQELLKAKVLEVVKEHSDPTKEGFQKIADQLAKEIDEATTFTVDATDFLNRPDAIFSYPIAAFEALADLTNTVYFELSPAVRAYHYGDSWVLKNKTTGATIKNLRMLAGFPPGKPLDDPRALSEVGITPGCTLVVERVTK